MAPPIVSEADALRGQAAIRPDKIALVCGDERLSYAELDRRASRVANGLLALGLPPDSRVAILTKNRNAFFEIFYGIVRAGLTALPVNWRLTEPEIAFILDDAGTECLFFEEDFRAVAGSIARSRPGLCLISIGGQEDDSYEGWREAQPDDPPVLVVSPNQVMVQFYTSGTTGHPKGVEISHRSSQAMRRIEVEPGTHWTDWGPDDVVNVALPNFHLSGTSWALQWLARGATCIVQPGVDPEAFLRSIEEDGVTQLMAVPTVVRMMLDNPLSRQLDLSSLRTIWYGGASMPAPLLREAMDAFGCDFVQIYGMTETNGTTCYLPPEDHMGGEGRLKSCGRPLPSVSIRICGPDGEALPVGETGEICINSPALMKGYWKRPDTRAFAFHGDHYRTGDVGYRDTDGYLFIVDRLKDMVVSGGENVYPAEIERVLQEHPQVREIAVIGVPDARWGEAVKAVVVPADPSLDPDALIAWARSRLAGYKLPKSVTLVDTLPRNANGKILKRALRERFAA